MDFVLTLLSARNHDLMPSLKDVSVHAGACATYDLTREAAEHLGLPETACHPQDLTHHLGLYFMAARGAEIAGERSEEHTSELQSLLRISYAVFCLKKKNN